MPEDFLKITDEVIPDEEEEGEEGKEGEEADNAELTAQSEESVVPPGAEIDPDPEFQDIIVTD